MDPYELTRMLYARVQALDPRNVSKIIGYLLLQDEAEQDMLRMALGSDALLLSMVARAKQELGISISSSSPSPFDFDHHRAAFPRPEHLSLRFSTAADHQIQSTYHLRDPYQYHHPLLVNSHIQFHKQLPQQAELINRPPVQETYQQQPRFGAGVFPNDHFYPETFAFLNRNRLKQQKQQQNQQHQQQQQHQKSEEHELMLSLSDHGSPNSSTSSTSSASSANSSLAWKPCVYYSRGHCKHGSACRFLHSPPSPGPENGQEPGSEPALESEIQELLRGRKSPVPISILPQLYYEEFGRPLYSMITSDAAAAPGPGLTSLLSRLKNTLVIDQPNGQQAVVLVDESPRFVVAGHHRGGDHYDHTGISPSSRQIYLTFPAESAFTEEDVNAHFSAYGPVQDVRIPYQQKRMFGFVTFIHTETVKTILAEGNPHYICGARVLVKPYRDKVKHGEKKNNDQSRNLRNDEYLASKLLDESMQQQQQQQQRENFLHQKLVDFRLSKTQTGPAELSLQETHINLGYILGDDDTQTRSINHIRSTYSRAPENPFAVIYEQEGTKLVT